VSATPIEAGRGWVTGLDFELTDEALAHEPPEARGLPRDGVRLLLGRGRRQPVVTDHVFTDLPDLLRPGDLLVFNTSATLPAALDASTEAGDGLVLHLSTELGPDRWVVELRSPRPGGASAPYRDAVAGMRLRLAGGGVAELRAPVSPPRLWAATLSFPLGSVLTTLRRHGRPIRYDYVYRDWPLSAYQSVFADDAAPAGPGSAEMPSAARPFTDALVTRLAVRGVLLAPITLHTGLASPEAHEKPYAERYQVSASTAALVNHVRGSAGRVIAVGTTTVRALESASDEHGVTHPASGWTELVVTPERGVRVVDGLLTGFHEPAASHLAMLAAVAGEPLLRACYQAALDLGYRWHEFGDVNLLLP
jgi:S-adenosylmethionine:tRNA ribosyltransferase-isomerase